MTNPGSERDGGKLTTPDSPPEQAAQKQAAQKQAATKQGGSREAGARTSGTNRDFDEAGESRNQGHGHPREERGRSGS